LGSLNGRSIDAHFGHLRELLIYEVFAHDARLVERREIARYCHGPVTCGDGETALAGAILALHDCAAILCSGVGFTPWRALETAGIEPNSEHAEKTIEQALRALYDDWRASGRLMLAMTLSRDRRLNASTRHYFLTDFYRDDSPWLKPD